MESTPESGGASRGGTVEVRSEADRSPREIVSFWREQIRLADQNEKEWRDEAQEAVKVYSDRDDTSKRPFNILYSNTETIVPAIYNSLPVADVRRRFGDPDPVGKVASQVLQRALDYCMDAYPFHEELLSVVYDMALPGRGVARVRYVPQMAGEMVEGAEVTLEHVYWEDYRQHSARNWRDVRWIAFRHSWSREDLNRISPEIGPKVPLGATIDTKRDPSDAKNLPDIYKRAIGWEIWDKERRECVLYAEDWAEEPLAVVPDPYGLKEFFPAPRPLADVQDVTGAAPICPYKLYKAQAEDLNKVSKRIMSLVNVLKWRGFSSGQFPLEKLETLADGQLIPLGENPDVIAALQAGSLDNAIWLWPIEKCVVVLRELIQYRESIKATIYEITGVSDILRGSTDPNETATAQGLKAQWGSQRMARRQAEVQRFVRDILRMKAELIAEKMPPEQLAGITGVELPDAAAKAQAQQAIQQVQMAQQQAQQAGYEPPPEAMQQAQAGVAQAQEVLAQPTWEEVAALLRSDAMRGYRVDIETDSTIRADVQRWQESLAGFIGGVGQLVSSFAPVITVKPDLVPVMLETLKAGARSFKLGKQLEDAIEKVGPDVQMPETGPQEDPQAKMQAEMERERMKGDIALQIEDKRGQTQMAIKEMERGAQQQMHAQSMSAEAERANADFDLRREDMAQRGEVERQKIEATAKTKGAPAVGLSLTEATEKAVAEAQAQSAQAQEQSAQAQAVGAQAMERAAQAMESAANAMQEMAAASLRPRRVVRGPDGRAAGVEVVQ